MQHYDLIVIGSGPAGRRAGIQAAKFGKSVLVVDRGRRIGGVSVHTGTIPSKTLRETVLNLSGWRERGFYGLAYRAKKEISADDLLKRMQITLNHEVEVLEHQFARNAVTTVRGRARFISPEQIEVTDDEGATRPYSASRVIVAVGTKPHRPAHVPFDGETILDSDEILELSRLPRHLVVVGAGVIGVEYATIFSALDVRVTLIEARTSMLEFIDHELMATFTYDIRDRGISLRLGCTVKEIEKDGQECTIRLEDGRVVRSDMVLYAAGRMGATDDLSLEAVGLKPDKRGRLEVDESYQTKVPHIYAAGDVIGFPSLASTSMAQGRIAACHAFDHAAPPPPAFFPYGIYAVPEMSMIGKTEEELRDEGVGYEAGVARFRETSRGHIMGLETGLLKMLFALDNRRLLGVHVVGEGATELIHIGQAVLNLHGTLDYFIENTFNYPTLAEAYKVAALDAWNRMELL